MGSLCSRSGSARSKYFNMADEKDENVAAKKGMIFSWIKEASPGNSHFLIRLISLYF